jgi:16S rRNA processing protein RimM
MTSDLLHVATVTSAHGVKGELKVFCLLETPENLKHYKEFLDEAGTPLPLKWVSLKGKQPIASMAHIVDKNAADALKNKKIFVRAASLPETDEGIFYSYQLVGLQVVDGQKNIIGTVGAHHNFGAGDILEITFMDGKNEMIPFKDPFFPEVDIANKIITYQPPEYM